jgi:hypothetical protein
MMSHNIFPNRRSIGKTFDEMNFGENPNLLLQSLSKLSLNYIRCKID